MIVDVTCKGRRILEYHAHARNDGFLSYMRSISSSQGTISPELHCLQNRLLSTVVGVCSLLPATLTCTMPVQAVWESAHASWPPLHTCLQPASPGSLCIAPCTLRVQQKSS